MDLNKVLKYPNVLVSGGVPSFTHSFITYMAIESPVGLHNELLNRAVGDGCGTLDSDAPVGHRPNV